MGSGVGLFIGLIGLKNGGIISGNESTLLSLGDLNKFSVLLSILGFLIISILSIRKISGSTIIGIFTITSIAVVTG